MIRLMAVVLALLCASCAAQAEVTQSWPPFPPSPSLAFAAAAAPERAPAAALEIAAPLEEVFACAGGQRLTLRFSADRSRATARWGEGAAIEMRRADDEAGLIAYAGAYARLHRSGPRAAWRAPASVVAVRGDTLSKLALALYGDMGRAADIAAANAIADPNRIYVGQELRLPAHEVRCRRVLISA